MYFQGADGKAETTAKVNNKLLVQWVPQENLG